MRVLICGSRKWPTPEVAEEARVWLTGRVYALPPGTVVIEGAAEGVDRWAGEIATRCGLFVARVEVGPQHYKRFGKQAPIRRDWAMLSLLQSGDMVVAAQFAGSSGTQWTIDEARRRGIAVELRRWLPIVGEVTA